MKNLHYILAVLAISLSATTGLADTWTLGVWNVENLGPNSKRGFPELKGGQQLPPRTNAQLEDIADYIQDDLGVDAIMLSEIVSTHEVDGEDRSSQLDTIVTKLDGVWEYHMGSTGRKSLAFLFNTARIRVEVVAEFSVDEFTIQGKDIFDRDPLVVWIDVLDDGGEPVDDLLLIGLHLKSVQTFRDNHLVAVVKLITELKSFKEANGIDVNERDVIILGDMNDSAHRRVRFNYMFNYLEDKRFAHLRNDNGDYPDTRINGSEIDHIFIANHLEFEWIDPGSFTVHVEGLNKNDAQRTAYRRTFSDHFPLTFEFEFAEDE